MHSVSISGGPSQKQLEFFETIRGVLTDHASFQFKTTGDAEKYQCYLSNIDAFLKNLERK